MDSENLKTAAFIDYEHWYISLKQMYNRKPDIQVWFDHAKQRGRLTEVTVFGDFSEGGLAHELNSIRRFTSRIIETKNSSSNKKENFTDFIMLDNIYQAVMQYPDIEQIILVTGDGHFSSAASYLRNFCSKVVGMYAVKGASSYQLAQTSSWYQELPLDLEWYNEAREAIVKNFEYLESTMRSPTFFRTVQKVAEHYNLEEELVKSVLTQMIDEGVVYQISERSRFHYPDMRNVLKLNKSMLDGQAVTK